MTTNADRSLYDRAHAAAKKRPDLPREAIANAWDVGPYAVIALCERAPTPEQLDFEEKERRRKLRLAEVRRVAGLALEAKLCLDGNLERMDDSTRRDVSILIGSLRHDVDLLAWWSALDTQHDIARKEDWRRVRTAAERLDVKEVLHKTHSAIQSAIAESHVPKKKRKASSGYSARSR